MASIKIANLHPVAYENELKAEEIEMVKGGVVPLLAVLAFVYYEREAIDDFSQGVIDRLYGLEPRTK